MFLKKRSNVWQYSIIMKYSCAVVMPWPINLYFIVILTVVCSENENCLNKRSFSIIMNRFAN